MNTPYNTTPHHTTPRIKPTAHPTCCARSLAGPPGAAGSASRCSRAGGACAAGGAAAPSPTSRRAGWWDGRGHTCERAPRVAAAGMCTAVWRHNVPLHARVKRRQRGLAAAEVMEQHRCKGKKKGERWGQLVRFAVVRLLPGWMQHHPSGAPPQQHPCAPILLLLESSNSPRSPKQ